MLIRYSTGITAIKPQVKYLNFGSLILSFVLQDVQRALLGEHSIRQKLCAVPQFGQLNLLASKFTPSLCVFKLLLKLLHRQRLKSTASQLQNTQVFFSFIIQVITFRRNRLIKLCLKLGDVSVLSTHLFTFPFSIDRIDG